MLAQITFSGRQFTVDLNRGFDLSTGFDSQKGPLAWGAGRMEIKPVCIDDWVGSVREGAPVNFCDVIINPHGQGTHTECVGHITEAQENVNDVLTQYWFAARVVSGEAKDKAIDLSAVVLPDEKWPYKALLVRTLPNDEGKLNRNYFEKDPPHFHPEDLERLADGGVQHFLTDLPSVDPEVDGGALAAHRAFFLKDGRIRFGQTITEFVFIPDSLPDGDYLLNLQLAPIAMDAAPSRPLLYPIQSS